MGQTDTRLYKVAVTLGGNYVHGRQYDVLTQVFYAREDGGDGKSYVSRKANKNVIPGTDPTVWQLVSDTGDSAYQVAVRKGYTGTEEEWLLSLVGDPGTPAGFGEPTVSFDETPDGVPSVVISAYGLDTEKIFDFAFHNIKGLPGPEGDSAYKVAVEQGFVGTKNEWLASLVGPEGPAKDWEDFTPEEKEDVLEGAADKVVNNKLDTNDLQSDANDKIQLADRAYNSQSPNGMGYVILRKNKTFAEQVTSANTIYEIRYDFDLNNASVTIPAGCVLRFNGGSIKNGVLIGNNSSFNYDVGYNILNDCIIKGFDLPHLDLRWFGAVSGLTETSSTVYAGTDCHDALITAFANSQYYSGIAIKFVGNFFLGTGVELNQMTNNNIVLEGTYHNISTYIPSITLPNLYIAAGITAIKTGGKSGAASLDSNTGNTLGAGLEIRHFSARGGAGSTFLDYSWYGGPVRLGYVFDSSFAGFSKCFHFHIPEGATSFSCLSHLTISQCQLSGTYAFFSQNDVFVNSENQSTISYRNQDIINNAWGVLDSVIIEQCKVLGKVHIDTPNGIVRLAYNAFESNTDAIYIRTAFPVEIVGNQFESMAGTYIASITELLDITNGGMGSSSALTIKGNNYSQPISAARLPIFLYGYIFSVDADEKDRINIKNYGRYTLAEKIAVGGDSVALPTGCVGAYRPPIVSSGTTPYPLVMLDDEGVPCTLVNSTSLLSDRQIRFDFTYGLTQVIAFHVKFLEKKDFVWNITNNKSEGTVPSRFVALRSENLELNKWYTCFVLMRLTQTPSINATLYLKGHFLMTTPVAFGFANASDADVSDLAYIELPVSGSSAIRETLVVNKGYQYFDEDLGKPLVSNGTAWVNMDGTPLA